jgi:hypothetical protein
MSRSPTAPGPEIDERWDGAAFEACLLSSATKP